MSYGSKLMLNPNHFGAIGLAQPLGSILANDDIFLMNQGATWRQFDAGLQGEDHALYQRRVIGWDQAWPFGEVHAQPMAIAARLGAAGAAGDNLIHNVKQLRRGRTRSCGLKCGICGLNQTAVSGGNIRRWAAHGKVAIEIAKIAIMHQACVQHQDISRLERAVVRWRDDIAIAAGRRSTGKIGHPIGAFIQTEALKISKHRCQRLADAGNLRHAVKGAGGKRLLTDLVSLVRFAMEEDNELVPFPERVSANYKAWLASQENAGNSFYEEQQKWLGMIRDHISANLSIDAEDFEDAPFFQEGGLGKVHQLFGEKLPVILDELNEGLAA